MNQEFCLFQSSCSYVLEGSLKARLNVKWNILSGVPNKFKHIYSYFSNWQYKALLCTKKTINALVRYITLYKSPVYYFLTPGSIMHYNVCS